MRLVAGATTDVGRVREGNEDSFLVDEHLRLYAVADGMGGHRGGEVASATALEALRAAFAGGTQLGDAVAAANHAVHEKAADQPRLSGMGTTLTALGVLADRRLLVAHVGDSRAYLLHDGELAQLTEDHSLVEELRREGRLTEEEAAVHPQRSVITRALGIEPAVDVDTYGLEVQPGDVVILCSDGLTTMMRPADIARVLRRERDPQRAADVLVDDANEAGGDDNITVVVLRVDEAGDEPSAPGARAATAEPAGGGLTADRPPPAAAPPEPATGARVARAGRGLWRFTAFAIPILIVLGVGIGAIGWYARSTYFVRLDGDQVVIYRGVPGGLLGWNPTVERRTDVRAESLTQAQQVDLGDAHRFASRSGAVSYVARLRDSTTASSTTTTTIPPLAGNGTAGGVPATPAPLP